MGASAFVREPVTTEEALREVIEPPMQLITDKETASLDELCRDFIARSPFVLIASTNGAGRVDISPKGDPAGFVAVLDDTTLAVPDRPGNHRADTFLNVLQHPYVGLIFLIPGTRNTLRVRGRATIARDLDLRERLSAHGRVPELVLVIDVTTAYFHCAKCIIRSKLWDSEGPTPPREKLMAQAMVAHGGLDISVDDLHEFIVHDEDTNLY